MKMENASLIIKFPRSDAFVCERLRKLLTHYTGKLVTKTECNEPEEEDGADGTMIPAQPYMTTVAELTITLNPTAAEYILNIIEKVS